MGQGETKQALADRVLGAECETPGVLPVLRGDGQLAQPGAVLRGGDALLRDRAASNHLGTKRTVVHELCVNAEARTFSEPGAGILHAGIFGVGGG